MGFDFALVLVIATLVTGAIWALDTMFFKSRRLGLEHAAGIEVPSAKEPVLVEYSRTFFPIILLVLVVRSFLFEPFRIPSDSMMPTLLDGDFIFVNKYVYGLRLPVINKKIMPIGEPGRGDVVVFKLPSDPSTNYIKRLVGLPGDRIQYVDKRLVINGEPVKVELRGVYRGHDHDGATIGLEYLGSSAHEVLYRLGGFGGKEGEYIVPDGQYFFMGDNRDNSKDSRYGDVGFVPEGNIVGKAVRIWMNIGEPRRIWDRIE